MKTFTYYWLYIPTGKCGTHTQWFNSRTELLERLNEWNRSAPGVWQFWAAV